MDDRLVRRKSSGFYDKTPDLDEAGLNLVLYFYQECDVGFRQEDT